MKYNTSSPFFIFGGGMNRLKYIVQITEITSDFIPEEQRVYAIISMIDEILDYYKKNNISAGKDKINFKNPTYHDLIHTIDEKSFLMCTIKLVLRFIPLPGIVGTRAWRDMREFYIDCI